VIINLEGIDGSGKTTAANRLLWRLRQRMSLPVYVVKYPEYQSASGQLIRRILDNKYHQAITPEFCSTLWAINRFDSDQHQLQAAADGQSIAIVDRYVASNLAYLAAKTEGAEQDRLLKYLDKLEHGTFGLPVPDLLVYLDMPVDFAIKNVAKRDGKLDVHERDRTLLEKVNAFYRDRLIEYQPTVKSVRICCVKDNALVEPERIVDEIVNYIPTRSNNG
jgi:dTMP kinase